MKNTILIVVLFLLIRPIAQAQKVSTCHPVFWIWYNIDGKTEVEMEHALKHMEEIGVTGILASGDITQLRRFVKKAATYRIVIHAWFVTMNRRDISRIHPEWLSVNRLGQSLADTKAYVDYYKFVCPALPEVRTYIKNRIEELCKIKGLAGVHLDYIRYVDAILPIGLQPKYGIVQDRVYPQWDYGYHPYMRSIYKQKAGVDPLDLPDPNRDTSWQEFRWGQVTEVVKEIDTLVRSYGKVLTAAVFPTPEMSKKMVYQDWDKWPLEEAFPMLYHNFYNEEIDWIGAKVKEDVALVHAGTRIVAGLFTPALEQPEQLLRAIKVSLKNGALGVALFGLDPLKEDKRWEVIRQLSHK